MSGLKLAGLLCSRLCHDLAGPIGALQNSLELLAEDDDPALREQALDLVAMASSQASRKLRFFRLVFGAGLSGGQTLSSEDCRTALADFLDGGRIAVQWDLPPADWSRAHGRLLLALALLASHGLPRGGRILVGPSAGGGSDAASIAGEGVGARLDAAVLPLISGELLAEDAQTPSEAIACLAGELRRESAREVAVNQGSDQFAFQVR